MDGKAGGVASALSQFPLESVETVRFSRVEVDNVVVTTEVEPAFAVKVKSGFP